MALRANDLRSKVVVKNKRAVTRDLRRQAVYLNKLHATQELYAQRGRQRHVANVWLHVGTWVDGGWVCAWPAAHCRLFACCAVREAQHRVHLAELSL